jgi:hypothetical protein
LRSDSYKGSTSDQIIQYYNIPLVVQTEIIQITYCPIRDRHLCTPLILNTNSTKIREFISTRVSTTFNRLRPIESSHLVDVNNVDAIHVSGRKFKYRVAPR